MKLQNVVRIMAEKAVDQVQSSTNCCSCDHCRMDAIAIAANKLKPHYVVSTLGETLTVNNYLTAQKQAEVLSEAVKAVEFVAANPRH